MLIHPELVECYFCDSRAVKWKFKNYMACQECGDLIISGDHDLFIYRLKELKKLGPVQSDLVDDFFDDPEIFAKPV